MANLNLKKSGINIVDNYITTYAQILNNPQQRNEIETEYLPYKLPKFDFPINFSASFAYEDPDHEGYLSSMIDHIISILDAKPSINILSITIFSYSNEDFINSSICIMLKPNQSIDFPDAQIIANNIKDNWDNPIQISVIPNNHILILNMHENF